MKNKLKSILLFVIVFFLAGNQANVFSENTTNIINAPTAFVNGFGGVDLNFEAYLYNIGQGTGAFNNGGMIANFSYGFTDLLDVGISFDLGDLNKDGFLAGPVDFRQPKLFAKMQLLTGTVSVAMGYDARGYREYNLDTRQYKVSEKGYYLVLSRKNKVQSNNSVANITAGVNIPDFEVFNVNGFFASIISLNDKLLLFAEYSGDVSEMFSANGNLSIAAHIPVAPESFGIDVGVKNIGRVDMSEFYVRLHLVKMM